MVDCNKIAKAAGKVFYDDNRFRHKITGEWIRDNDKVVLE
jgi:hypothetical protein